MSATNRNDPWPELSLDWQPTYETLHRWVQIVGKTRLRLAPFENHWWHCALYVTTRGLTTSPMPYAGGTVEIEFNFLGDALLAHTSDGQSRSIRLEHKSVATFYKEYRALLSVLGVHVELAAAPNELADATPFADDHAHRTYDGDAARRWFHALTHADRALKRFRGEFVGKCSPSHFWWGGFDLACTRFSGREAPRHPGGIPNCPAYVMHEAYSRECISAGWWPGSPGSPVSAAAFYAYVYPVPAGLERVGIRPTAAAYQADLGEWILPYRAVCESANPEALVAEFLESTYVAAATLAGWDISALRTMRE
jgi:hypothetical protein